MTTHSMIQGAKTVDSFYETIQGQYPEGTLMTPHLHPNEDCPHPTRFLAHNRIPLHVENPSRNGSLWYRDPRRREAGGDAQLLRSAGSVIGVDGGRGG